MWDLWWTVAVGQVFSQLLTFSLVRVIPPLLHTYSLNYYPRCIILITDQEVKTHPKNYTPVLWGNSVCFITRAHLIFRNFVVLYFFRDVFSTGTSSLYLCFLQSFTCRLNVQRVQGLITNVVSRLEH